MVLLQRRGSAPPREGQVRGQEDAAAKRAGTPLHDADKIQRVLQASVQVRGLELGSSGAGHGIRMIKFLDRPSKMTLNYTSKSTLPRMLIITSHIPSLSPSRSARI